MTTPPKISTTSSSSTISVDGALSGGPDVAAQRPLVANSQEEAGPRSQALYWIGTLNNYTLADLEYFESQLKPIATYYVCGKEIAPTTNTPHLQFFFALKAKKTSVSLHKIWPKCSLFVKSKKSTMAQASDYCKKEGNFFEWGILPVNTGSPGLKVIADNYAETVDLAKKGDMSAINPEHMLKYFGAIKKIQQEFKIQPANLTWAEGDQPNWWIHGPTGTGKSYLARDMLGQKFYAKNAANKWWDKYNGEENVLIEDMDLSHVYQGFYLKIWADKYAFPVEVKCSGDVIRPKVIIVTSNYSLRDVFPDPAIHEPLERRFKTVHKFLPWNATIANTLVNIQETKDKSKKKSTPAKKRKYDMPLKKPALLRRNAMGDLVPGKQMQPTLAEKMPRLAQSLAINIEDTIDSSSDDSNLISSDEEPEMISEIDNDDLGMEEDYSVCPDCECPDCICDIMTEDDDFF